MTSAAWPVLGRKEKVSPSRVYLDNIENSGGGVFICQPKKTTFSFIQSFDVLHNTYTLTRKCTICSTS